MATITDVLDEFLAAQEAQLDESDYEGYEEVVGLLRSSLNMYGYNSLQSEEEQRRFDEAFGDGDSDEAMEAFCRIFGPEKIPEHYYEFLSYFLIRKVFGSEDLLRTAGAVTEHLANWLADRSYVDAHLAAEAAEMAAAAGELLPRADRLNTLLYDAMQAAPPLRGELADDDFYEEYAVVTQVEPGRIWFDGRGPVAVPTEASDLAQVGWQVNVVLGRGPAGWQILELGHVYPM